MSESEFTAVFFTLLGAICVAGIYALGYHVGHKAGVVAEWNRINDAKMERDRLRRLRDGRTREHKRAMKACLLNTKADPADL